MVTANHHTPHHNDNNNNPSTPPQWPTHTYTHHSRTKCTTEYYVYQHIFNTYVRMYYSRCWHIHSVLISFGYVFSPWLPLVSLFLILPISILVLNVVRDKRNNFMVYSLSLHVLRLLATIS